MEVLYWMAEMGAAFIEGYILLAVTGTLLQEERTREQRGKEVGIAIAVAMIVVLINSAQLVSTWAMVIMPVLLLLSEWLLLKREPLRCCIIAPIYYIVLLVIDFSVILLLEHILRLEAGTILKSIGSERLIALAISKGILVMIYEVICWFSLDVRKIWAAKKRVSLLYLLILFGVPAIQFTDYMQYGFINVSGLFGNVTCIVSLVIFMKYLTQSAEQQQRETELKVQEMKNKLLENSLQELNQSFSMWRTSVHDYKHAMLYIAMLVENNRLEELTEYLAEENHKIEQSSHYYKTGNPMLDVVVNTKAKVMRDKGIPCSIHIDLAQELCITERDLGILFGNLLDNAIEAAELCEEAYILLTVESFSRVLEIEIVNTYAGTGEIDFQTTKPDKAFHGIGLQSVNRIVERYDGKMSREVDGNEVLVHIMLINEMSA